MVSRRYEQMRKGAFPAVSMYGPGMADDTIIQTPDGPMTWAEWKKKNPIQVPSRRTKGKDLPNKIKRRTGD
jgi:hypothetical protein